MLTHLCLYILALFMLAGCDSPSSPSSSAERWQEVLGRDEGQPDQRKPIYRAKVPSTWQRIDAAITESIADSTKANCEFLIGTEDDPIHLVVHSFPSSSLEDRIPPQAQIQRWQRQFDELDLQALQITPCAQGGFTGLCMSAEGLMKGRQTAVLAWSMQLAPLHFIALQVKEGTNDPVKTRQRQSDYTIKAFGPPKSLAAYRSEIMAFAASFEMIEEIPLR